VGGERLLVVVGSTAGAEWPVLTAEPAPRPSTDDWTFKVQGLVERVTTWTWGRFALCRFGPTGAGFAVV
jgi:hypothetical protein